MTSKKDPITSYHHHPYTSLPPPPPPPSPPPPQNYVVLTYYNNPPHPSPILRILTPLSLLLFLTLTLYLLFPSNPTLTLIRAHPTNIQIKTHPTISLSLSLSLTLKVQNRDFLSLRYDSLKVSVLYRDRVLGVVESDGGFVKARGGSYVESSVVVDGLEILHDVFYLVADFASGSVPFDTVSDVDGVVGFFFFNVPIKAKVSCEVFVNPMNQTIIHQNCYPE